MHAHVKEATDFVEEYFTEEPTASIDACVRDALTCDIPVTRDQVSGIRRALRQRGVPLLKLVPTPPADKVPPGAKVMQVQGYAKNPPKPPQWFIDKQKREDELYLRLQAEELPPDELPEVKEVRTIENDALLERRRYFETVLMEDPKQTVVRAMKQVKTKFGTSVDPGFAVRTLHLVRELYGISKEMVVKHGEDKPLTHRLPIPSSVPVTPRVVPRPVAEEEMYALFHGGSKQILAKKDLEAEIQKLTLQGGTSAIRVFLLKEVKMKTTVSVSVSFE